LKRTKHFLVTGGAGFIGSHIAERLVSIGHRVTVVDNLSNGREENVPEETEFIQADLADEKSFSKLKKLRFDAAFHLAAQSSGALSFKDPLLDLQSHVMATFFLLEWCKKNDVGRFLFSSSTTIYGDPEYLPVDEKHPQRPKTYYAAGKMACEAYIRFYQTRGINGTIFRLPNVYGPGQNLENKDQGMISIYLSYMLENRPIIIKGSLDRFRDFIYVDDVVDGFQLALDHLSASRRTFNLASGKETTVGDILMGLESAFGQKDYPVEMVEGTPGDQFGIVCDTQRIKESLGWIAKVSIQEGLKETVAFEKRRLPDE